MPFLPDGDGMTNVVDRLAVQVGDLAAGVLLELGDRADDDDLLKVVRRPDRAAACPSSGCG
jgi:hypothetical protein